MSHRIARLFQSLWRFLRRPIRSPQAARPVAVPGIGIGSCGGMPTVVVKAGR
ncbi:hypothetical protein [Streptomyces sp. NL15-2K]|uniref:hypothetical protein n=1 Tax=Streptomyces sp. NL15-2K TaxID=376149 RepID=UPI000FF93000|nr:MULTISPECIES: hypothetical protein [Actinomycetes]WKX09333.1 hypothetical protein Q4V64_18280 [Kutzneria buriramensis]GCB49170.1 hypothetical protein SNL152K_6504 [Streptomyces sp. NL15-2K]